MRAHYVPRFYLKNFGDELYFYDKTNKSIRRSNPQDIAVEKNFYGSPDETRQLEDAMCKLEGGASTAIRKIMETLDYSKLSSKEKSDFCSFVALQHLRTPETRTKIAQIAQKLLDTHVGRFGASDFTARFSKEFQAKSHLDAMSHGPLITYILDKMGVLVSSNATDVQLWTSDNPVTLYNSFDQFPYGNLGFASTGIRVHIPLSPELEVIFFDPTTYPKDQMFDFVAMEKRHVLHANNLQALESYRFMYSNTAEFFRADRYLESDPKSGDVYRARISEGILETVPADSRKEFYKKPKVWIDVSQLDDAYAQTGIWRHREPGS